MSASPAQHPIPRQFEFVREWDVEFLALWSHRYDYLWAEHPNPEDRPEWKTESRYPLSDRLIQQGSYLYGVRFGTTTRYLLLDIDKGSVYHPSHDRWAWRRMVAVLEMLGLVQAVLCTSSYSGGMHLYLPFDTEQKTWKIALAVTTLLENAGFKLAPGQLEVFPHSKPYSPSGEPSLYHGHRLPMQAGSYLINSDLQMIWGDQQTFVQHWQLAQQRNAVDEAALDQVLRTARRRQFRLTGKANKFLNDLNAEIEPGWTGYGQTNRLLGRIAMRSYIFGHVLYAEAPLTGTALVEDIARIARSLPGYTDWSRHQHEIEQRAQEWGSVVEASHYYPFGSKQGAKPQSNLASGTPVPPSWNQQQAQSARDRISQAVADLLSRNALPSQVTARKTAIKAYGIGSQTLDKYQELWHPNYLQPRLGAEDHPVEIKPPEIACLKPSLERQSQPIDPNKFVPPAAAPQGQAVGQLDVGGSGGFSTGNPVGFNDSRSLRAAQHLAKMQSWLDSGDPILMGEAQQYFQEIAQPEPLNVEGVVPADQNLPLDQLGDRAAMLGGFGAPRATKRQKISAGWQEIQQLTARLTHPVDEPDRNGTRQSEIEALLAQDHQAYPEEAALAWSIGVYNPLAQVDLAAVGARFLEPEEEDWLAIARMVDWLLVDDELAAIYFTAPPPAFALEQADWYVRPDLTAFLESPMLLREVVQCYPIPVEVLQEVSEEWMQQLGWTRVEREQFIQKVFGTSEAELTKSDWEVMLFELQMQMER
ncbi:hypothetical protein [Pantanalinema sp. GBBB05]|uniref:hypothetical protein n=1 Tax=Pantanalinema sp. GBBB05 TaxID=2604139 RepID=UPI001DEEBF72|nr:hypothetical protein [Pantanalinema sp. GBBB05]